MARDRVDRRAAVPSNRRQGSRACSERRLDTDAFRTVPWRQPRKAIPEPGRLIWLRKNASSLRSIMSEGGRRRTGGGI